MNLDDLDLFDRLDPSPARMIDQISALPDHLLSGYQEGLAAPLPAWTGFRQVILLAAGQAALAADLLASCARPLSPVPVTVLRGYELPAWAQGPGVLVAALSAGGGEEEVSAAFSQASERGCRLLALSAAGTLARSVVEAGGVWVSVPDQASYGQMFGRLLALAGRLGLVPDPASALREAADEVRAQQAAFLPGVPVAKNPAKRMAGQLVGRSVILFASEDFLPAARHWKNQVNLQAKTIAHVEELPDADYNSLVGLNHPEALMGQVIALFLLANSNHPRSLLRLDYTRQMYMAQAVNTDIIQARGAGPLAQLFTLLSYGDYAGYYLAMAYQENPRDVETLVLFQEAIGSASQE